VVTETDVSGAGDWPQSFEAIDAACGRCGELRRCRRLPAPVSAESWPPELVPAVPLSYWCRICYTAACTTSPRREIDLW